MVRLHPATQTGGLLGLLAFGLICLLDLSGPFTPHRELFYDRLLRLGWFAPPVDERVVVVALDNARLMGEWPWPHVRRHHAQVLQHIHRDGAKAIALHFLFLNPAPDPADDQILADTIRRLDNIILPVYEDTEHALSKADMIVSDTRFSQKAHGLANASVVTGTDGITRQIKPVVRDKQRIYPALGLLLAHQLGGGKQVWPTIEGDSLAWDALQIPLDQDGLLRINYLDFDRNIPVIPYSKVLKGHFSAGTFRNKVVLVGSTDIVSSGSDFVQIPLAAHAPVFGIVFHAQVASLLLKEQAIHFIPRWQNMLLLLLLGLASALGFKRSPRLLVKSLLLVGLLLLVLVGSYLLLTLAHVMFEVVHALLLIILAFVLVAVEIMATTNRQLRTTNRELVELNITLEDKVIERTAALEHSYTELQRLQHLKDELVHMVVHDLKNPLAAMLASTELFTSLYQKDMPPESQELLLLTHSDGQRMLGMIQNILDISKMEDHKMELQGELLNLVSLAKETLKTLAPLAQKDAKILHFEAVKDKCVIWGDAYLIQRVLHNLLSNALKYTQAHDTITIQVTNPQPDWVQVAVCDTGLGIPPEYHQRIFEKFEQAHTQLRQTRVSTGLGLTFCKMVVELHNGSIWVQSQPQQGSQFIFKLPLVDADFQEMFEEP